MTRAWYIDHVCFLTNLFAYDVLFASRAQNGTSMVSCETYKSCFDSEDMASMNNCLNGGTHGPVHIAVGGEWDNPEEAFINTAGKRNVKRGVLLRGIP